MNILTLIQQGPQGKKGTQGLPGNDGPPVSVCIREVELLTGQAVISLWPQSAAATVFLCLGPPWQGGLPRRERTAGESVGHIHVRALAVVFHVCATGTAYVIEPMKCSD